LGANERGHSLAAARGAREGGPPPPSGRPSAAWAPQRGRHWPLLGRCDATVVYAAFHERLWRAGGTSVVTGRPSCTQAAAAAVVCGPAAGARALPSPIRLAAAWPRLLTARAPQYREEPRAANRTRTRKHCTTHLRTLSCRREKRGKVADLRVCRSRDCRRQMLGRLALSHTTPPSRLKLFHCPSIRECEARRPRRPPDTLGPHPAFRVHTHTHTHTHAPRVPCGSSRLTGCVQLSLSLVAPTRRHGPHQRRAQLVGVPVPAGVRCVRRSALG
jgi:hypothetical protein